MIKLGVVGATGLVGLKILEVLKEENLLEDVELFLIASEKSANKKMWIYGKVFDIFELNEKCLEKHFDVVMFSAGESVSLKWAKAFADKGAFVIDNSNAFRRIENIPLVVPEINGDEISSKTKIISNPNCSTIQLVIALNEILKVQNVTKVVVSTYQSVSGAGKKAFFDYKYHTKDYFEKGIVENVIPCIGDMFEDGCCLEEKKIQFETNKILKTDFDVVATSVRVPVPYCHGESVYVELDGEVNIEEIEEVLNQKEYIKVGDMFLPTDCENTNLTYVCRLRKVSANGIAFFVIADNLRRGAAFNAVEIYKKIRKIVCKNHCSTQDFVEKKKKDI